jgi:FMN-dependent NADH-azoreductase
MNILHIDSSILGEHSVSRLLSAGIVARLRALHPNSQVLYRDLTVDTALHLSDRHWSALKGAEVTDPLLGADVAMGNGYIDDLFAADVIVIGAPMYNFSIPSQLKVWIDRVAIAGRTFKYDANGVEGLVKGKKLFLASSRGGFYTGDSPVAFLDHHETYLKGMMGFIGMTDVTVIRAEGINYGEEARIAAIAKANEEIAALAA